MDGKEDSLCTDGNLFPGLHTRHVCNGKPPVKIPRMQCPNQGSHMMELPLL